MISFRTALFASTLAFGLAASPVVAQDLGYRVHTKKGTFDNVRDDVKDAIVNRGFVIDYVGHFNQMLERTAEAAGRSAGSGTPATGSARIDRVTGVPALSPVPGRPRGRARPRARPRRGCRRSPRAPPPATTLRHRARRSIACD